MESGTKSEKKKGRIIIFEGLDGAGIETQARLLMKFLKGKRIPAEKIEYPDYDCPVGELIHAYLYNEYDFDPDGQVLLYVADMVKDKARIKKWLDEGKIVVFQRYITSTMAYQGLRGFAVEKIEKLAEIFDLPKPDIIIYLKVSADTSMKRKIEEKGKSDRLDRHEADKKFLSELEKFYENLAEKNVFGRWAVLDGEVSREEIFEQVKELLIGREIL